MLELEPQMENGTAPDFLFQSSSGERFYVEAVTASDRLELSQGARQRLDVVIDALNRVTSADFFLQLNYYGSPNDTPPLRALTESLQSWADQINLDNWKAAEPWTAQLNGAEIEVSVLSRRSKRQEGARGIGMLGAGNARSTAPHESIRYALERKSKRYGSMSHPYFIAVNYFGISCDEIDYVSALFGSEIISIPMTADGPGEPRAERKLDGLWRDQRGARRKNMSGAIFFYQWSPWTAAKGRGQIILHPWAENQIGTKLPFDTKAAVDGRLIQSDGISNQECLALPKGWPVSET